MKLVSRLFWTPVHLLWSAFALLVFVTTRRDGILVFTHFHDIVEDRDQQMGPLVDTLVSRGANVIEVTRIPFGLAILKNLLIKRRLFVSDTALLGIAWLAGFGDAARKKRARITVADRLLRALRPETVYVIDESGSGQPLVRAARALGIPVVAIQHGDFTGNTQYVPRADGSFDLEPADVLCVWSPWFRDRLLAVSPIYTRDNTLVTGRLRYPAPREAHRVTGEVRVLVLGESGAAFRAEISPYLNALVEGGVIPIYRPHPADTESPRDGDVEELAKSILACDVVLGSGSSGLIEAVFWRRPVIVFCTRDLDDPAGFVRDGLATGCHNPSDLYRVCVRLARESNGQSVATARAIVWEGAPSDPIERILAAAPNPQAPSGTVDS